MVFFLVWFGLMLAFLSPFYYAFYKIGKGEYDIPIIRPSLEEQYRRFYLK